MDKMKMRSLSLLIAAIMLSGGFLLPATLGPVASAGSTWMMTSDTEFNSAANGTIFSGTMVNGTGQGARLELAPAYLGWISKNPVTSPSPARDESALAAVYGTDQAVLFGGYSSGISLSDTWIYDLGDNRWTVKSPSTFPTGRNAHSIATIYTDDKVVLYGGWSWNTVGVLGDTWTYDLGDGLWTQKSPSSTPGPRSDFGMAGIYGEGKMVLFGGYDSSSILADTWVYDLSSDSWSQRSPSQSPGPRSLFMLASVYGTDKVILFGGYTGSADKDDIWVYDLGDNQWTQMHPSVKPTARYECHLTMIYGTDQVLLFGGGQSSTSTTYSDTWVYDLSDDQWTQKSPPSKPAKRAYGAMTTIYDTAISVLFGGMDQYIPKSDTWTHGSTSFSPSGFYCSPFRDLNGECGFKKMVWDAYTPTCTSVKVQLRTGFSESDVQMKYFVGPNGDTAAFYSSGQELWAGHRGGRWVQFKAYLATSTTTTPTLEDITLEYNRLPDPPKLTGPTNGTWLRVRQPTFSWDFIDGDGFDQAGFAWELASAPDFYKTVASSGEKQTAETSYSPDTDLTEGQWYWRVKTCDDAGDWGRFSNGSAIGIDYTPPKPFAPVVSPANWTNQSPQITFFTSDNTSGVRRYEVAIDDGLFTEQTSPYAPSSLPNGEHVVTVRAYDRAGNFAEGKASYYKDTAAPDEFTPSASPSGWANKNPRIFFVTNDSLSGVDRYEVRIDKGAFTTQVSPFATPDLPDGYHNVTVRAYDKAQNTLERTVEIFIDKTAPAPFTAVADPAGWTNTDPRISFEANDAVSGIDRYEMRLDGGALEKRTSPCTLTGLSDGEHNITVRAYDRAGNSIDSKTKVMTDFTPPAQTSLKINNGAKGTTERRVMLLLSAIDLTSGVDEMSLSTDGDSYTPWEDFNLQKGFDLPGDTGKKTVYVKIRDRAGNVAPVARASIIYDPEYGKEDNSIWVVLGVVVVAAAAGAGGFLFYRRQKVQKAAAAQARVQAVQPPWAGMEYVAAPPPEYAVAPAYVPPGYQHQYPGQTPAYSQGAATLYPAASGQYPAAPAPAQAAYPQPQDMAGPPAPEPVHHRKVIPPVGAVEAPAPSEAPQPAFSPQVEPAAVQPVPVPEPVAAAPLAAPKILTASEPAAVQTSLPAPEPSAIQTPSPAPVPYDVPAAAPAISPAPSPAQPKLAVYIFDKANGRYTFVSHSMITPQSIAGQMTPSSMLVATSGGNVYAYFDPQAGKWVTAGK